MAERPQHSETEKRKRLAIGALCIVAGGICWGFSGTCIEYLTQHKGVTVAWASFLRLSLAAIILLIMCFAFKRDEITKLANSRSSWRDVVIYGIFGCFGCQYTYMASIALNNAGVATLIEQLGLVIVVFWTCFRKRRSPRARELGALALAFAGMFCICTQGDVGTLALSPMGLFWGLASTVTMAFYVLLPARLMRMWSGLVVTAPSITIAAIVALVVLRPWETPMPIDFGICCGVAGTVIFGVVSPYLLFLKGLKEAGPVIGGLLDCIEPVAAMGFSALLLGTAVTGFDILGSILIISMMIMIALPERKKE